MRGITKGNEAMSGDVRGGSSVAETYRHYRLRYRDNPAARDLFVIFLSLDLFFILLYAAFGGLKAIGLAPEIPSFQLNDEAGLASIWNYAKLMVVTAILTLLWKRETGAALAIMAGLFLFMLVDDYYELHDQLGRAVGERISLPGMEGLHPQNRGELFVYAVLLCLVAPLLWLAVVQAKPASRLFILALTAGIFLIGFFGVAIDVFHGVLEALLGALPELVQKIVNRLMTILEDGGEMVSLSLCLWLCLVRLTLGRGEAT